MQISHETPLCLLERSREFNDYDYCLVHLCDHPDKKVAERYFKFFKESLEMGRKVILDNSAYELGDAVGGKRYADWINKLRPTEYIIPDVRSNGKESVRLMKNWIVTYGSDLLGTPIGVVHGVNLKDMKMCYVEMESRLPKLAFSFEDFYFNQRTVDIEFIRSWVIRQLSVNYEKPHHLLGVILPQEIRQWRGCKWIETMDTSSPVLHAFQGIRFEDYGLDEKSTVKIDDIFESAELTPEIEELIQYNVSVFRSFL